MVVPFDVSAILVLIIVGIISYILYGNIRRPPGISPGPPLLPIVGNIPLLAKSENIIEGFKTVRKKYGDIFSLKLGTKLIIVVNGYDSLKDFLVRKGDGFTDRPRSFVFDKVGVEGKIKSFKVFY